MRKAGIQRELDAALKRVNARIAANRGDGSNRFAAGMSGEGFDGGYAQALRDVGLVMAGVCPSDNGRDTWADWGKR